MNLTIKSEGKMDQLFLQDLNKIDDLEVRKHISDNYAGAEGEGYSYGDISEEDSKKVLKDLSRFNILIAYESVGSWGCDSTSWFLLQEKETGFYFEFSGSHCSCYGFEGQYKPDKTEIEYLKSDKFSFYCGGYDDNETENQIAVKRYLKEL